MRQAGSPPRAPFPCSIPLTLTTSTACRNAPAPPPMAANVSSYTSGSSNKLGPVSHRWPSHVCSPSRPPAASRPFCSSTVMAAPAGPSRRRSRPATVSPPTPAPMMTMRGGDCDGEGGDGWPSPLVSAARRRRDGGRWCGGVKPATAPARQGSRSKEATSIGGRQRGGRLLRRAIFPVFTAVVVVVVRGVGPIETLLVCWQQHPTGFDHRLDCHRGSYERCGHVRPSKESNDNATPLHS